MNLINGDCIEEMAKLDENSVDTIITDPPYGLSFMGKEWDDFSDNQKLQKWTQEWATEAIRVAKPGAMMLCFGGTRTFHRIACGIEDAGWEVRDTMMWVYGSGFPKSYNIGKNLDGWSGWGTALKPAYEPIIVAMKPRDGTFVENALKWGVAGLNIDGGRVPTEDKLGGGMVSKGRPKASEGWDRPWMHDEEVTEKKKKESADKVKHAESLGRWPANLVHDGSEEATSGMGDKSRYFYCAKASRKERNAGLEGMEETVTHSAYGDYAGTPEHATNVGRPRANNHPTVKPLSLMTYLCRLTATPTGGIVLDPFMGSGTTGMACKKTGRDFIGIELDEHYFEIAKRRVSNA